MDKYYHVAAVARRETGEAIGIGFKSACIKCSPDEDITIGVERFAHLYFPDADGWSDHIWDYGRIADDIIAFEQSAAHAPSYTIERQGVKATVLKK